MAKYIPYNYNQHSMVVINYLEQLQPGTFEHAIHFLIENKLDLSIFYPNYKNDDGGRPAYDPAILLKIILFAYSKGITSSRTIQWCCETNIIFKALSCDTVPHYTTLASFISSHGKEIENIFEQILLICDEQGLLGHELFAIDGCKMSSDASKEWSLRASCPLETLVHPCTSRWYDDRIAFYYFAMMVNPLDQGKNRLIVCRPGSWCREYHCCPPN